MSELVKKWKFSTVSAIFWDFWMDRRGIHNARGGLATRKKITNLKSTSAHLCLFLPTSKLLFYVRLLIKYKKAFGDWTHKKKHK